jgi:hypothetical protein
VRRISTSLDRRAEDVGVLADVVLELRLDDIQRQVLAADLVEAADDRALDHRPEALNHIRVDRADGDYARVDGHRQRSVVLLFVAAPAAATAASAACSIPQAAMSSGLGFGPTVMNSSGPIPGRLEKEF